LPAKPSGVSQATIVQTAVNGIHQRQGENADHDDKNDFKLGGRVHDTDMIE